jgi:FkbM family methyltransferase
MLIKVSELVERYGVRPTILAHIGGHKGEEAQMYEAHGWVPVTWFEALPENVQFMKSHLDARNHCVVEGAVWNTDGIPLNFKVATNTLSSSLFDFGEHTVLYPDIGTDTEIVVMSMRLDCYFKNRPAPDYLSFDIQGAELAALEGAPEILASVKWIYTEVSRREIYKGAPLVAELDEFLEAYGFKRLTTRWLIHDGWGDALYVKIETDRRSLSQWLLCLESESKWIFKEFVYLLRLKLHRIRKRV